MKTLSPQAITNAVKDLFLEAVRVLPGDVCQAFEEALQREESPLGRSVLTRLIENKDVALKEGLALCQDTGSAVVFIEWGDEVVLQGGGLAEAVNEGVRQAYRDGYYRKSVVNDPVFDRKNTGDNTPCILHVEMVRSDMVRITAAPKGGGSENMSGLRMLKPAEGVEGVKRFILDTVEAAGGNPCPPVIVGVGIGGTMEKAALLSKKALLREVHVRNADPRYAALEEEVLNAINGLGIGPMGFGGRVTALAVHIEFYPCHIASLPVAVNIQCHSARHKEAVL